MAFLVTVENCRRLKLVRFCFTTLSYTASKSADSAGRLTVNSTADINSVKAPARAGIMVSACSSSIGARFSVEKLATGVGFSKRKKQASIANYDVVEIVDGFHGVFDLLRG